MVMELVVFALVGLFTGAAARLFYPGRETVDVLATLLIGAAGSVLGGLLSFAFWPALEGHLATGALLLSALGAMIVLAGIASIRYTQRTA